MKKNGEELTAADAQMLEQLSKDISVMNKNVESLKNDQKSHQHAVQEFAMKQPVTISSYLPSLCIYRAVTSVVSLFLSSVSVGFWWWSRDGLSPDGAGLPAPHADEDEGSVPSPPPHDGAAQPEGVRDDADAAYADDASAALPSVHARSTQAPFQWRGE